MKDIAIRIVISFLLIECTIMTIIYAKYFDKEYGSAIEGILVVIFCLQLML